MNRSVLLSILILIITMTLLGKSLAGILSNSIHAYSMSHSSVTQQKRLEQHILYVSDQTGSYNIYRADLDGSNAKNISNSASNDMNPQVSPDGKRIVFYSDRTGNNQIYTINMTNGKVSRLTDNDSQDYDPSFSPDGKLIAFKSTRDDDLGDIFVMNADGKNQHNLTSGRNTSEEWNPKFSSNGERIFFVSRQDQDHNTDEIYRMNRDGSEITQLTENDIPDWYPSVNPINGSLVYISKVSAGTKDALFTMHSNGTKKHKITNLPGNSADPSWNLTGDLIIFVNDNEKNYNIYISNADGSNMQKLTNTPYNEISPIFIP